MGQANALMRPDAVPNQAIARVEDLQAAFTTMARSANLVSPVASVGTIAAMHAVSLRAVMVDPETDCYVDSKFCKGNTVALGGVALQKIAAAAGVQMLGVHRLDDRSEPNYCAMQVSIGMRDFDGTWRPVTKSKEIDLRNGSAEATGMTPANLANARKHIQSNAETKAFYRALRTLLQLRQTYTRDELKRPFVVPKLVPALDPSDPEQKQALIRMALGSDHSLYGAPRHEEPRALPEAIAIPAPMAPPPVTPPPPTTAARAQEPDEDDGGPDGDAGQFDLLDMAPEIPTEPIVCLCPCACQREIGEETARITKERVGSPRCGKCYPGKDFDFEAHKDLKDLQLPKMPGRTAVDVRKAQLNQQAQAAGARK